MADSPYGPSNFPEPGPTVTAPQPLQQQRRFSTSHLLAAVMVFAVVGVGVRQFSQAGSQPQLLSVVEGEQLQLNLSIGAGAPHAVIDAPASAQQALVILQPADSNSEIADETVTPGLNDKKLTKLEVSARTNSCIETQTQLQIGIKSAGHVVVSQKQTLSGKYEELSYELPQPVPTADNPRLHMIASFTPAIGSSCRSSVLIDKVSYYGSK